MVPRNEPRSQYAERWEVHGFHFASSSVIAQETVAAQVTHPRGTCDGKIDLSVQSLMLVMCHVLRRRPKGKRMLFHK